MQLNPAATKASSSANEVGWSAVHPNTLPPKTNGAISKPEAPSLRFSTSNLTAVEDPNSGGHIIVDTRRPWSWGLSAQEVPTRAAQGRRLPSWNPARKRGLGFYFF